jgi:hypothetical protein
VVYEVPMFGEKKSNIIIATYGHLLIMVMVSSTATSCLKILRAP